MRVRFSLVGLAVVALTGCAIPALTVNQMQTRTQEGVTTAIEDFQKQGRAAAIVKEISEPRTDFKRTEAPRVRGDITLSAASVPFAPVLSELGRNAGYSVAFSEGVDASRKVTVSFNGAVTEDAIRTTAFLAGYAAVIDKQRRTVMVSDMATYTFKLPPTVFSTLAAQYTVGGNPASSGGSSGGGGAPGAPGGGASPGGSSLKAEFNVTGRDLGNTNGLGKFLSDMAGKNAEVYVADSGHISVRANAQALRRVHDFLKSFARDAMSQVEMEASVVEVALTKSFSLGIQWTEVVEAANRGTVIGGTAARALAGSLTGAGSAGVLTGAIDSSVGGGLSSFKVDATTSSLISALAQFTEVNIVSQPRLLSMNNAPATFFDGTQLPYLGSVQQTPSTAAGGSPTTTGSVAFALDGVSFSAVPSVMDEKTVQITLIPVISGVSGFETFLSNTLTAPRQTSRQTYMRVLAESGKTLILGGIRYNKDNKQTTLPSSISSSSSAKEVVILLRAKVIPAPNYDPIVNESL